MRTTRLYESGVRRIDLERALKQGAVFRPQRGWIALPDADPELIFAARHHVVLSCVTQAKRLKLWVRLAPEKPHVAPPGPGAKIRHIAATVHWRTPQVLRPPFVLVDQIENVLCHVAECQSREDALVIWESAFNNRLISYEQLSTLPLNGSARKLLEECTPFSDSGLESLVQSRLRWLPTSVLQQVHVAGHRVDLLIGARLILQIDGASRTGDQRTSDIEHDAELIQMNYTAIRVSYAQVMFRWEEVQSKVLGAYARGKHLA